MKAVVAGPGPSTSAAAAVVDGEGWVSPLESASPPESSPEQATPSQPPAATTAADRRKSRRANVGRSGPATARVSLSGGASADDAQRDGDPGQQVGADQVDRRRDRG